MDIRERHAAFGNGLRAPPYCRQEVRSLPGLHGPEREGLFAHFIAVEQASSFESRAAESPARDA